MKEWIFATLIVLIIVGFPTACTMDEQRKIAEASARGEDPIAIKCAMGGGMSSTADNAICILKASQRKQ